MTMSIMLWKSFTTSVNKTALTITLRVNYFTDFLVLFFIFVWVWRECLKDLELSYQLYLLFLFLSFSSFVLIKWATTKAKSLCSKWHISQCLWRWQQFLTIYTKLHKDINFTQSKKKHTNLHSSSSAMQLNLTWSAHFWFLNSLHF